MGPQFERARVPDIFISYSREDRPAAALVASSLQAEGFTVWWDAVLRAGESYDEVTEDNLRNAGAVVVLWSKRSSRSKWVRAEATIGERHSTLVPAIIEDCDRPLRFELIQTADLTQWKGDREDENWKGLVADISVALSGTRQESASPAPDAEPAAPAQDDSIEAVFWSTIKDTTEPAELEAYLKRYKNGHFVDLARARLAAIARNASPRNTSQSGAIETPGAEDARVPQPLIAIAIFALATMVGMTMMVVANAIHIGWFSWSPSAGAEQLQTGVKEIGFFSALNWSVAALVLMPIAWALIYLAITEARDAWAEMVRRRMLVTKDFVPIDASHSGFRRMQKHIRLFVFVGIIAVTALTLALALSDYAQVADRFYDNSAEAEKLDRIDDAGYELGAPSFERDWMVAALLSTPKPEKVKAGPNRAFSFAAYAIYVGFGVGSLLSFGLVSLGLGATFMRGIAQTYGLSIIPDINSNNKRCGFEVLRRFFIYAYAVAFIGCVLCYLMGIQNIYLRSPDASIFAFLSPDPKAFSTANDWRESADALFGFLFADSVAKGTRNVYVWIFGFFIFAVFIGGFILFVRQGALLGKSLVLDELRSSGLKRLQNLTHKDESAITSQLAALNIWPLIQPDPRASIAIVLLLVASFIFYKIGVLIVLVLSIAVPIALWKSAD